MRSSKIFAAAAVILAAVSCGPKASIRFTAVDAPECDLSLRNVFELIDSVKTDKSGSFSYNLKMEEGQPEFVYVYRGETKLASLLLSPGEKAVVTADTLGNYSVSGSEESAKLQGVEQQFSDFMNKMNKAEDSPELSRLYISYYRDCIRYIMENPHSLTVIPVLYQKLNDYSPIFSQTTDAMHFRRACDSLMTVYPDSKYVKILDKEAQRRENIMMLDTRIKSANELGFPNVNLPDMTGKRVALSDVKADVILVHFWDASNASQKMFNNDVLKGIYNDYHSKGLEIYSICLTVDKVVWADVVKSQNLPWINVNDGLGTSCPAVAAYNVTSIPATVIIAGGSISTTNINGEAGLRKELDRLLK